MYERVVVTTLTYGAEACGRGMDVRYELDIMGMKYLRSMWAVTKFDR